MIDFIENVCQAGCQKALYCKTYARFQVTLWATEIKKISLVSRSWSTVWINMQKMSNGDYFDEKMRRGDRSKEARRISPPLKLLLKSPKLRGSTAPKSAHLHRGREQGETLRLRRLEGILRLTQVLYASPPADLPLATEFARPSLTIMVPSLSTCAHASLNCWLPPNPSRGNGVISKVPHTAPSLPQVLQ